MSERDVGTALRAFAHHGLRPCLSFLASAKWSLRVGGRSFHGDTIENVVDRAADYASALLRKEEERA